MSPDQVSKIKSLASDIARREGCVLYDLEFSEGGARTLRVYIDRESSEGVSLDDCVNVSRGLNLALDVDDVIPGGRYELEVSSPGLERKLTEPWHYQKAIGKPVQIKYTAGEVNKTVKGVVTSANDTTVEVELLDGGVDKPKETVPLKQVLKAKVVFLAPEKKGPPKKQKKKR